MESTTIFSEFEKMLYRIDRLVFPKKPIKTIEHGAKEFDENGFLVYFTETDSYAIHERFKTMNREDFTIELSRIRSNKILIANAHCYLDGTGKLHEMPEFSELPEKSFEYALASLCAHEVRHRKQFLGNTNFFKLIHNDYEYYKVFENIYTFNNHYLIKLIEKGVYIPKKYYLELDAMMVEEIFMHELWLAEQNGLSFHQSLKKASVIISADSNTLRSRLYQICFLGFNYFK